MIPAAVAVLGLTLMMLPGLANLPLPFTALSLPLSSGICFHASASYLFWLLNSFGAVHLRKVSDRYVRKCVGILNLAKLNIYQYYLIIEYMCILGAYYVGFRYIYVTHNWYNVLSSSYHPIDFV